MRAAIYSPYLDSLGGGERYVISVAKILKDHGWDVFVESKDSGMINKLGVRFGLNLSGTKVIESIRRGDGYDLCFWLSDGSVPTLFARRNFLHFQRPFVSVDGRSLINRMKFFRIEKVIVNSEFTKSWTDKEYPKESVILYPPVDVTKIKSGRKENIILYVGRFSQLGQSKRQDILVKCFKKIYKSGLTDWRLVLAGGSEVGGLEYAKKLLKDSKNCPIDILKNPSFNAICDLYKKAKIFWSAAGYGIDEKKYPEKLEHFGITPVEAMAAKCVPVLYDAGGHKEIVEQGKNGFLWRKIPELINYSMKIANTPKLYRELSVAAKERSNKFSYKNFEDSLLKLINE